MVVNCRFCNKLLNSEDAPRSNWVSWQKVYTCLECVERIVDDKMPTAWISDMNEEKKGKAINLPK